MPMRPHVTPCFYPPQIVRAGSRASPAPKAQSIYRAICKIGVNRPRSALESHPTPRTTLSCKLSIKRFSSASKSKLLEFYRQKVNSGTLQYDARQECALEKLASLHAILPSYEKLFLAKNKKLKPNWLTNKLSPVLDGFLDRFYASRLIPPKGFYIYGDVGSGKTMIMDLFLEAVDLRFKHRTHFNSFMINFHESLFHDRTSKGKPEKAKVDLIDLITDKMVEKSPVLCLDEFQVTDIADAMILSRLFGSLWSKGAVILTTSNRHPDELYKHGLQRELFLPFIESLKQHCIVHDIDSSTDYRAQSHQYNGPGDPEESLEDKWKKIVHNQIVEPRELQLYSRKIVVPRATEHAAWFTFDDLCVKPLGPADYKLIASTFRVIFLADIPVMTLDNRNEARRFITLIDELYDRRAKLIIPPDVQVQKLFPTISDIRTRTGVATGEEEVFAFARTVSRLLEMQTAKYLEAK
ncbi:AFG1-like ATPase [Schistocerca gregaria]|uniref:AFG1-like ATPase n=1 Tax=Schistocerca gregaria TaxID=7010 RepID=UPI00211E57C4|nr:AFG1-like ATPase [Schistocerca gregaria]